MFDAGWKVEKLKRLVDTCQELIAAVSGVIQVVDNPTTDMIQANVAGRLGSVRQSLSTFTRDLSRHQRSPASHIFVFMISAECQTICSSSAMPPISLDQSSLDATAFEQFGKGDEIEGDERRR